MAAEIISTVERRRHWPDEEKLRIMGTSNNRSCGDLCHAGQGGANQIL
jgi:hypothetical protein